MKVFNLTGDLCFADTVASMVSGMNCYTEDEFVLDTNILYNKHWRRYDLKDANEYYIKLLQALKEDEEDNKVIALSKFFKSNPLMKEIREDEEVLESINNLLTEKLNNIFKFNTDKKLDIDSIVDDLDDVLNVNMDAVNYTLHIFNCWLKLQINKYIEFYSNLETNYFVQPELSRFIKSKGESVQYDLYSPDTSVVTSSLNAIEPIRIGMVRDPRLRSIFDSEDQTLDTNHNLYPYIKEFFKNSGAVLPIILELHRWYQGDLRKVRVYRLENEKLRVVRAFMY